MKTILIFLLNIFFFLAGNAQKKLSNCENMRLKGYIITQYKESDIIESKKSSIYMIDIYYRPYFIPIQNSFINDQTIDSLNVINYKEGLYFSLMPRQMSSLVNIVKILNTNLKL